jgi:predicted AAA+ superfamily ATPase
VDEYLDYLNEAFLALRSKRMDSKTSEYLSTSDKFYAQDLGIRNHVTPYRPEDIDGLLENVVYNELVYRFGEVCTYSVNDLEVDFIADPKNRPKYFQVCTSIADPNTLEREIRPFRELKDNYPKTLIIYERYPLDEIEGARVVNLFDWLLE